MPSRRNFLGGLVGSTIASNHLLRTFLTAPTAYQTVTSSQRAIDRSALVRRHNPVLTKLDPLSPLTVGNGTFAFTADVTGLQTLDREYENAMPLCTMSQWGWHSNPRPANLINATLRLTPYDAHGRRVGYQTSSEGQVELFNWLRENPHRLHLGLIGLCRIGKNDADIALTSINEIRQELDLWRGVIRSTFRLDGEAVSVTTTVHPELDVLSVSVESNLIKNQTLGLRLQFPFASSSMQAADWKHHERHLTTVASVSPSHIDIARTLDDDNYFVSVWFDGSVGSIDPEHHTLILKGDKGRSRLDFTARFSAKPTNISVDAQATLDASTKHWQRFWTTGGALDLSASTDPRAEELERRIVLSQYLTTVQCSGNIPPQETGLTVNSWYGKFHLEMHWWHAAHFAWWNRLPLFERSLSWYESILPQARALAKSQGYEGARWPKMVGPEGHDSPSPIGPLLIWQQPHPIFYAELCYQSHSDLKTLRRYADLVFETAAFMSSYAYFDQNDGRFVLGPPVIPAQENHPPTETWNPTFELAYWAFGLRVAQEWRERLGMKPLPKWTFLLRKLSLLPVREGVYLAHENCPQTYTERNRDHPSMLAALGFLSGDRVDRETMRRTLHKTIKEWRWDETWGWDYPLTAMTAARLGEGKIAVDALMMKTEKNRYLPNGHNYQRPNLPCYLPGNGGLLYAVAMMAIGWNDAPREHAPGFPNDGSWKVNWEGMNSSIARSF